MSVNTEAFVGTSIRQAVERGADAKVALNAIEAACDGDAYLVGGAIRDSILGSSGLRDLDIVIPENDQRVFDALDGVGATYTFNRRGMRRYRLGELQMDLIEPSKFYRGLSSLDSILRFFDLRINALGLHLSSNIILDPLKGHECYKRSEVGINWPRWNSSLMNRDEQWLLLLRLVRVTERYPALVVESTSKAQLQKFTSKLEGTTWDWAATRFPPGEEILIKKVKALLDGSNTE